MSDMDELTKRLSKQLPVEASVRVKGGDYAYDGWIVCVFNKRSGVSRCVVEDEQGRLFIHNLGQITFL
jgi:hypothetical protein